MTLSPTSPQPIKSDEIEDEKKVFTLRLKNVKIFKISHNPFDRGTDFLSLEFLEPRDLLFRVQVRIFSSHSRRN